MKALTFRKKLKDGRCARLRISNYYVNTGEFAAVSLVAHHHRRTANDWLRKTNKCRRGKAIDGVSTGCGLEVIVWAADCIINSFPVLWSHGYRYILVEAKTRQRLNLYKNLIEKRYGVTTSPHEYEDRPMLEVSLQSLRII